MNGWVAHKKTPWTSQLTNEICKPPEDFNLPSDGLWVWNSNWKIENSNEQHTDKFGWEYASKLRRFCAPNRPPRPKHIWGDNARRRMWIRFMIRNSELANTGKPASNSAAPFKLIDFNLLIPKIQAGLSSIHSSRLKIESILQHSPESAQSEDTLNLVSSVQTHITEILDAFHAFEPEAAKSANTGVLKKLRNDVLKEQTALLRALNPHLALNTVAQTADSHANDLRRAVNANICGQMNINSSASTIVAPVKPVTLSGPAVDLDYHSGVSSTTISQSQSAKCRNAKVKSIFANSNEVAASTSSKLFYMTPTNSAVSGGWGSAGVKSGNAKAFNPSLLVLNSALVEGDNNEGIFVVRSPDAHIIEQRLVPVGEEEVMRQIIDERAQEINQIHASLVQVNEMFADMSRLLQDQQVGIDQLTENAESAHAHAQYALSSIAQANQLQRSSDCAIS